MIIAHVLAADGVRYVAVAQTHAALFGQLARYVAERAADVLWPRDATAVRRALVRGDEDGAVKRYFAAVGARWDAEWLSIAEGGAAPAR